jgi:kinesin family protein C1
MTTPQDKIFYYMMDLIRNTLDGEDLCIFAYGQTGSGKTFTMNGNYDHVENLGLIPRTLNYLFC